jgi:uncharacterized protein
VIAFADSSALVKLYADEAGSSEVRGFERFVVAQIARVEVPAALWKKQRIGDITIGDAGLLVADFEADWFGTDDEAPRFDPVRMTSLVVEDAARLTGTHGLRTYDAIQLATARAVHGADPSITLLAAFDRTLRDAAVAEGFDVVP